MIFETKQHDFDDPWSPSDDDLIAYLFGETSAAGREQLEGWLATDARHGQRLCGLASTVLAASQIAAFQGPSTIAPSMPIRLPVSTTTAGAGSQLRPLAALLALAATALLAIFSLDRLRVDSRPDSRVAIAWAESLAARSDAEVDDVSQWLFEPTATLDPASLPTPNVFGDEASEPAPTFGFSSEEPPEWLLTAVSAMQSSDRDDESSEAVQ